MTQLATYRQKGNSYALALTAPVLKDMPADEAKIEIANMLSTAYYEIGASAEKMPDGKGLGIMARALLEEVKNVFPNCTVAELKLCIHNGVRKEYGDYYGLNIATFNQWLKAFAQSERRRQAKLESERNETHRIDKEEAHRQWKQCMLKYFNEYKTTGKLYVPLPFFQYGEYEKMGLINLTPDEKRTLTDQAKINVLENSRRERAYKALNGRLADAKKLNTIITNIENNQQTSYEQTLIKCEARYLAIKKFYDGIEQLVLKG